MTRIPGLMDLAPIVIPDIKPPPKQNISSKQIQHQKIQRMNIHYTDRLLGLLGCRVVGPDQETRVTMYPGH